LNRKRQHIDAFTILIGLIAVSANRFSEQLKMTNDINQELNEWFAFRSNLWLELYACDSIKSNEGELLFFAEQKTIKYRLDEEELLRFNGRGWTPTNMEAESIRLETEDEQTTVIFDFKWKGEPMTLSYYFEPAINHKINDSI